MGLGGGFQEAVISVSSINQGIKIMDDAGDEEEKKMAEGKVMQPSEPVRQPGTAVTGHVPKTISPFPNAQKPSLSMRQIFFGSKFEILKLVQIDDSLMQSTTSILGDATPPNTEQSE